MTQVVVRAVLFDMDGTLVDSTAMVETLWRHFAIENGADATEVIDFAHGRPSRDTVARFAADPATIAHWLEWIHTAESEHFNEVTAIPGAVRVARDLPSGRWAVVTSALAEPAARRLALVGIPVPEVLIGADDVSHGKPDPTGYAHAAELLGEAPADCVVFEDTEAGVLAGLAAGCAVVVVGAARSDAMAGLPRIADFSNVKVSIAEQGITLTLD